MTMIPEATEPWSRRIAVGDRMWDGNDEHYHGVTASALATIESALAAAGSSWDAVGRILDLPCGHGRVLRGMRSRAPAATIVACDLDLDGVNFCADEFDAVPILSSDDPAAIVLPDTFDLIWCGSLLTHLPAAAARAFLDLFVDSLAPGGVGVVTLHGREMADRLLRGTDYGIPASAGPRLLAAAASGHGFEPYPGHERYGISLSTPMWVIAEIVRRPDIRLVTYTEGGWDRHQDVLAFRRT